MTTRTSKYIQAIAVLMMIVHHLFAFPDRILDGISYIGVPIGGGTLEEQIAEMCKICVSMFAFISGYGLAKKKNISVSYIAKKVILLLIGYWFCLALFIIARGIQGDIPGIREIILNVVLWSHSINHGSWYLAFYILSLVTIPFWKWIIREKNWRMIICLLFFWAGNLIVEYAGIEVHSWLSSYLQYMPVVLIAIAFSQSDIFDKCSNWLQRRRCSFLLSVVILVFVLALRLVTGSMFFGIHLIWIYITPIMITMNIIIQRISKWRVVEWILSFLGNNSTAFWLLNPIFTAGILWIQKICFFPRISILIVVWAILLMTPFACIYKWIEKRSSVLVSKLDKN